MKKSTKVLITIIVIYGFISLFWLVAHIYERYPWNGMFSIIDPDSLLFARLLEQSVLKGKIVSVDNYGCFPYEITHGLAPIYFTILYYFIATFYTFFPNCGFAPVMVAGTLPIIFTWLLYIVLVFTVWFCSKNKALTILCGACLLPGAGTNMLSGLLKLDYDWAISFCIWSWLCCYCLYSVKKKDVFTLCGGIIATLLIGIWTGSPLFFFLCTLYGIYIFIRKRDDYCLYFEYMYSTLFIASILNILYLFKFGLPAEKFIITKYSWFQIVCSLVSAIFFYVLFRLKDSKKTRLYSYIFIVILSSFVVLALLPIIKESTGFLANKDPIHSTISELTPFYKLKNMNLDGRLVMNVVSTLGWAGVFLPILIFIKPTGFNSKSGETLKDWSIFIIFMAMYQVRYMRWSGIALGLFHLFVFYLLWKILYKLRKKNRLSKTGLFVSILILLIAHVAQSFSFIRYLPTASSEAMEAYAWLKRNTPETSGYGDNNKPEYGILAYWDDGNLINYYAKRPTIVNNAMWGYRTMAEIFCSKSEEEAYKLCKEYKVRYIYINPNRTYGNIQGYWPYFKNQPKRPEYKLLVDDIEFAKDYKEYFWTWICDNLALTSKYAFKPAEHYRVVYVGNTEKNEHPFPYVILEVVEGAELNIEADPESEVTVSLDMQFDGIKYVYKKRLNTNKQGKVTFKLPYTTSHKGGRIITDKIYKILCIQDKNKVKAKVEVPEKSVINGLEVIPEAAD